MKLCLPADGPGLGAHVDARFGRAAYLVVVDSDTGSLVESVENHPNLQATAGAGIQTAQAAVETGADAVLCRHCGPKAFRVLAAAGVKVYLNATGTVSDAVGALGAGRLTEASEANVEGHW